MIFDSSSIFKLINQKEVDPLFDEKTVELAFYEVGNVIWKHRTLLEEIDDEKQCRYFKMMENIEEQMIKADPERSHVMETAIENEITFYDASYLQAAVETGETLVTEDGELREKAEENGIETLKAEELA
jgi:predicted nucleic acid-binding protein